VRVTTVDAVLRGLVLPCLPALAREHPLLQLELRASNELLSLTKRDADLALRALVPTSKPPDHLIGRRLGTMHFVVCAPKNWSPAQRRRPLEQQDWIAPDEGLPDHPTVRWRRRMLPRLVPRHAVENIVGVLDAVRAGLGVGMVPHFLLATEPGLVALTGPDADCHSSLWLLAHPESRHLRRIAAVYQHLADAIALPA
jgi:DNA-binding transcriptional LysR family regulator